MLIAVTTAGEVEREAVEFALSCLSSAFQVRTARLGPLADPEYAYDAARAQYNSPLILREALQRRPRDATRLLALTERDIFIPMLSFVYGQAQLNGPAAVLSFARLRQEFYGIPANHALFLVRVRKEVLHEMGHTFGLTHCDDSFCTMSLSTNIQQLDAKGVEFCESCEVLLREALGSLQNGARSSEDSGGSR